MKTLRQFYQTEDLEEIKSIIKLLTSIAVPLIQKDDPDKRVGYFQFFIKDEMTTFEKSALLNYTDYPINQEHLGLARDSSHWKLRFAQNKAKFEDYHRNNAFEPDMELLLGTSLYSSESEKVITTISGGNPDTNQLLSNIALELILKNAGYSHERYLANAKKLYYKVTLA